MKRCPSCGAKNKPTFEYCIRCSEPLDESSPEGTVARDRANLSKLLMGGIAAVVALAVLGLLLRGGSDEPTEDPERAAAPSSDSPSDIAPPPASDAPQIDSREVLARFNAGRDAYNSEDYRAAVDIFRELIEEIPDNATAHQYLGLSHYYLGEFPESMAALQSARDLDPDSFLLLDHYVTVAKKASDLESAAAALRSYIERNPNQKEPRLELSRLARTMGNSAEALEQASHLATEGASAEFQYEYAVSLKDAGRFDEARAAIRSTIELDPDSAAAHHALGVIELQAGKASEALGPLEAAVARAPENGDFRFSLAQAYEKLNRIPESLAAYEAYLQHADESDPKAKIIRERLEIAKKALAERNQAAGRGPSESP